jgi:hypothetical protein
LEDEQTSAIRAARTGGPEFLRLELVKQESRKSAPAWTEHERELSRRHATKWRSSDAAAERSRPRGRECVTAAKGSLLLTRLGLAVHATDLEEYRERVLDVSDGVQCGITKPPIWKIYILSTWPGVHEALERGKSRARLFRGRKSTPPSISRSASVKPL